MMMMLMHTHTGHRTLKRKKDMRKWNTTRTISKVIVKLFLFYCVLSIVCHRLAHVECHRRISNEKYYSFEYATIKTKRRNTGCVCVCLHNIRHRQTYNNDHGPTTIRTGISVSFFHSVWIHAILVAACHHITIRHGPKHFSTINFIKKSKIPRRCDF